jgi:hypothetical protein
MNRLLVCKSALSALLNFPMSKSVKMTTVRALPGTGLRIRVRGVSHFDDKHTFHALGRLAVYDVFDDFVDVSSAILG